MKTIVATLCFLVKQRSKEILLAEKTKKIGKGYRNGYGGKLENFDLSIRSRASLEVWQEGRVMTLPWELTKVALVDLLHNSKNCSTKCFRIHIFFAEKWNGDPWQTEEMTDPQWFSFDDIPYEKMMGADKIWLPQVLSGKKIKATFQYKTKNCGKFETVSIEECEELEE